MLRFIGVSTQGDRVELSSPKSLVICRDKEAPADSLSGVFSCAIEEELAQMYVYDCDELVYSGIVDEQILSYGERVETEVISRSMAALLLDNEALPMKYVNPSAQLIFLRYLRPLGFEKYVGENRCVNGEFKVPKGSSCYKVLEDFCRKVYGTTPREEGGVLYLQESGSPPQVLFSNHSSEGIPFSYIAHNRLRCKLISRVRVKTLPGADYTSVVESSQALSRGIRRERYLNASDCSVTSLSDAKNIIRSGHDASESITIDCMGRHTGLLGADAQVEYDLGQRKEGFYVSSVRYSLTSKGEKTRLILNKKEN